MITLYCAGPAFGLPEASPYVMKTEIQLQLAGLAYRKESAWPERSPKGQLPFIDEDGTLIADSHFIRDHIEARYGVDLDAGLSEAQRAQAWAFERMLENHLGWIGAHDRFLIPENFAKGPAHWFDHAPADQQETLRQGLIDEVTRRLHAIGIGRHSKPEIEALGERSLTALSALLADKPFLFGETPTSLDATATGLLATILNPYFDGPLRRAGEGHAGLVAYQRRMMARFYPAHTEALAA